MSQVSQKDQVQAASGYPPLSANGPGRTKVSSEPQMDTNKHKLLFTSCPFVVLRAPSWSQVSQKDQVQAASGYPPLSANGPGRTKVSSEPQMDTNKHKLLFTSCPFVVHESSCPFVDIFFLSLRGSPSWISFLPGLSVCGTPPRLPAEVEKHGKLRPSPVAILPFQPPAVGFHNPLGNGQAQARPATLARVKQVKKPAGRPPVPDRHRLSTGAGHPQTPQAAGRLLQLDHAAAHPGRTAAGHGDLPAWRRADLARTQGHAGRNRSEGHLRRLGHRSRSRRRPQDDRLSPPRSPVSTRL